MLTIEHEDGSVSRFHQDAVEECFLHEMARGRRHRDGEAPEGDADDAHPLTVALRMAADLEGLMGREGTIMGLFVGEDEILRGVRKRKGPPVEWNVDGTFCS